MKLNYKKTLRTCVLALVPLLGFSQVQEEDAKSQANEANYYTIVANERARLSKLDLTIKANKKEYKQFERWAYLWQDKINKDGSFPTAKQRMSHEDFLALLNASNTASKAARSSSTTAAWTQVGPTMLPEQNGYTAFPGKGRINVVALDPANEDIMYAGAPVGGVWKTTDAGQTWAPKSDNLAGLGVSDIIVDPNNSNNIYMATGDAQTAGQKVGHISSIGVYKSEDAGNTWTATGLSVSLSDDVMIRDIDFLPGTSTTIFATVDYTLKKSVDSGTSWTDVYTVPTLNAGSPGSFYNGGLIDLVFDPNDTQKMVMSDINGRIIYSSDGGGTWTMNTQFVGAGRNFTKLATTPNDPDHFYMLDQTGKFSKVKFEMTNMASDVVSSTTVIQQSNEQRGYNAQNGFNMPIAVSPTNKDIIMIGGVRSYKSNDNGETFSVHTNPYNDPVGVAFYTHPDHHYFGFKQDGVTVINGHDGGVSIGPWDATSNAGSGGFIDVSAQLNITQSYNIAVTQEQNGDNFVMANQDNDGFAKVIQDGSSKWVSASAGDGTSCAINKDTPGIRYLGGTNGALYRTADGWSSGYQSLTPQVNGGAIQPAGGQNSGVAFVSPMKLDPANNKLVYTCFSDVVMYDETNGANYTGDNSDWTAMNSGLVSADFIEIVHNAGTSYIYAIGLNPDTEQKEAKYYNGSAWTTIAPPSGQVINSITSIDNATIYCTVSGYSDGNKVFKSTNFGADWTNISNGLPNMVMKKMLIKANLSNETLFVATELGVYWKNSGMSAFEKLGTGLPNVRVDDLEINYTDELLYIGTFGRGMFKTSVNSATLNTKESVFSELDMPSVYPNPASSVVNVKVPSTLLNKGSKLDYVMYNSVGAVLRQGTLTTIDNQISVNGFSTGMYMIRISDESAKNYVVKKIIIE